jgi:hypothetical protein
MLSIKRCRLAAPQWQRTEERQPMAAAEVIASEIAERHATIRFTNPDRPVRTLSRLQRSPSASKSEE